MGMPLGRLAHFELPPQWSTMREAARLERGTGRQIIHMEKGDFSSKEFRPPREAIEAALESLKPGYIRYSPGPGLWSLREALAAEMESRGRPTKPEEIIVTPGAKYAIAATFLLLLDDGDEVIMPNPGYPPDKFWARYMRAEIKHVAFRDPRHVDVEQLEQLITPKTRLAILNTPQRPNGQIIANTAEIAQVMAKYPEVIIVSDEIFSKMVYPPYKHVSLSSYPEIQNQTVVIDTFSKAYVMTGFRIGWVCAPKHLADKYDVLLQNSCTNVSTLIQEAALAALKAPETFNKELVANLQRKRDLAYNMLNGSQSLSVDIAQGAFYLFPKLPEGLTDQKAVRLLLQNGVGVVPGSAFGSAGAGHVRLTFTLEDHILLEGVRRMVEVLDGK